MPHSRKRMLLPHLAKSLKHSPIVGILGQRQTGKTTLMSEIVSPDHYVSLDKATQLAAARGNPETFLERDAHPFGIDECQLAPELFPALKESVRTHKKPGQFLLTGSVRFTSRKLIRESLTGRIVTHELLPLCIAETHEIELGDAVSLLRLPFSKMRKAVETRMHLVSEASVREALQKGGLPGICFFREASVRTERFSAHLDTLLQRDIKLVFETTLPVERMLKALQFISTHQGKAISMSELSRYARISAPTLQKLIPAFEALFLIRRIETFGDLKRDRFFHEDQGIATHLSKGMHEESDLLRLLFSQCFAQMRYLYPHEGSIQSYETRAGARVPLVLDVAGEKTGIIPIDLETPDAASIAWANSLIDRHPGAIVAIATRGKEAVALSPRVFAIPYRALI